MVATPSAPIRQLHGIDAGPRLPTLRVCFPRRRFCVGAGYEFRRLRMAQAARHDASASPKSCGSTRLVPKT